LFHRAAGRFSRHDINPARRLRRGSRMSRVLPARKREAAWLAAAFAAFVFCPAGVPKFLFLGAGIWLAGRALGTAAWALGAAAFAAALYATTFLLTPVCASQALRPAGGTGGAAWPVQVALLLFGCAWIRCAVASPPPLLLRVGALRWRFALLWPLLLAGVYFLPWTADIAYGGDEHYHLKALVVNRLLGMDLLRHGGFALAGLAWLGAGVWLARKFSDETASPSAGSLPLQLWAAAGLGLAAFAPWLYPAGTLADEFNQDRMLRYPASQPWLGAWLWELTRGDWGAGVPFGYETLRFMPVLAVLLLGVVLAQEPGWRKAPPTLPLVGVLAVATAPTLLYHGTLLYLELALLPPLVLLLRAGRRWLLAAPASLAGGDAWWAALSVGFLKDTGGVAAGILWLARAATRGLFLGRRGELNFAAVCAEARVAFVVLGPGLLYLALRALHGSRPYQPHFGNLLDATLWLRAAGAVVEQFGVLWLPALAGAVLLARRRGGARLLAAGVLFGGMWLFHLVEEPRWVGLARFNLLLLLPAVLALAWTGLGVLLPRRTVGLAALLGLLAGNTVLSPVDGTGQRAVWGGSGERWYGFTDCLIEMRKLKPDARFALANTTHIYGIGMTQQRINWPADAVNLPVADPANALVTLRASLELAARGNIDFVIFRWDAAPEVAPDHRHAGYARAFDVPARGGTLTVFAREGQGVTPARP
jgi:hypothetical protein